LGLTKGEKVNPLTRARITSVGPQKRAFLPPEGGGKPGFSPGEFKFLEKRLPPKLGNQKVPKGKFKFPGKIFKLVLKKGIPPTSAGPVPKFWKNSPLINYPGILGFFPF